MVTVPWAGLVLPVTLRLDPASLASTVVPLRGVLAAVVAVSLTVTGVTVSATVAVAVCPTASVVVYVKLSGPE